jgi:rhodanese-related sulfurtransferase
MSNLLRETAYAAFALCLIALPACAQSEWQDLISDDAQTGYTVEGVISIDVATAEKMHAEGVKFLDSRSRTLWKSGQIAGAVSYRLADLATLIEPEECAVIYPGDPSSKNSVNASAYAVSKGYTNRHLFSDGFSRLAISRSAGRSFRLTTRCQHVPTCRGFHNSI